jgi:single-strand DNA-binding protein
MNKVILIGRLTSAPEAKYTQNNTCIARYTLAVNRPFKKEGQPDADFLRCIAFGKTGEFATKYLQKGVKVAVEGSIQTGSYEKDGVKHYTTEIVVNNHEFCESKASQEAEDDSSYSDTTPAGDFPVITDDDDGLPF